MKSAVTILACMLLSLIPAHSAVIVYSAFLNGLNEVPPNASPGTGFVEVTVDNVANTMRLQGSFSGLLVPATAAHIHCCTAIPLTGTAGVATPAPAFPGFPLGSISGSFDSTLDMTLAASYNGPFITSHGGTTASAESALFAGLAAGEAYFNIHTDVNPGGEIRGFLIAEAPEPGTFLLAGAVLAGLAIRRRSRN